MSISYDATSIRIPHLQSIIDRAGNGALLRGYDGTRPATGAPVTTQVLLFELTCGTPFGTINTGAARLDITNPAAGTALATGLWSWWRVVKADGTSFVMDGDATDFSSPSYVAQVGQPVELTGNSITEGNP
jgi:hypothetical protein